MPWGIDLICEVLQKVAALLREDCIFWTGTNEALKAMKENMLLYRDPSTDGEQKVGILLFIC
jgi:hypothetical protein